MFKLTASDIAQQCGISELTPGFYRIRLVKGGAFVAARLFMACPLDAKALEATDYWPQERRSCVVYGEANGEPFDALKIQVFGKPISKAEYEFLMADRKWAREHSPREPAANPRVPSWEFTAKEKDRKK